MDQLEYIPYISCYTIINRVKEQLYSFDSAGLIDEGQFFDWIKTEMQSLGLGYYRSREEIFQVEDYKVELPKGFYSLQSIYRCSFKDKSGVNSYKVKIDPRVEYIEDCEQNVRKKNTTCPDGEFEYYGKVIRRTYNWEYQTEVRDYELRSLLRYTNRVKEHLCEDDCPNFGSSSKDEFSITDNNFIFNFDKDSIYVQWYELAVDENGLPEIPDNDSVKEVIEKLLISKLFKIWWYNGVQDVERRMLKAEEDYKLAHSNAIRIVKTPSFQDLVDYATRRRDRFNIFYIPSKSTKKVVVNGRDKNSLRGFGSGQLFVK